MQELIIELAKEDKAVKDEFKVLFNARIESGYTIANTETLSETERRHYLAHETLREIKADLAEQARRRIKFNRIVTNMGIPLVTPIRISKSEPKSKPKTKPKTITGNQKLLRKLLDGY